MTHSAKSTREQADYLSFLLRLWRVGSGEATVWRASLQDTLTDERVSFASLEDLLVHLRRQMGLVSDAERDDRGSEASHSTQS